MYIYMYVCLHDKTAIKGPVREGPLLLLGIIDKKATWANNKLPRLAGAGGGAGAPPRTVPYEGDNLEGDSKMDNFSLIFKTS